MPILKYEVDTQNKCDDGIENLIITKIANGNIYFFNMKIKNVGMNTIKSLIIDCSSDIISDKKADRLVGSNSICVLEKNEEIIVSRYLELNTNENYDFVLTVYYEDVLSNWYRQIINLKYEATDYFDYGYIGGVRYDINKEIIIAEEEINKKIF